MTDFGEHGAAREAAAREDALANRVKYEGESAKFCQDAACGVRIPLLRRKSIPGVQLCAECQEIKEKKKRVGR